MLTKNNLKRFINNLCVYCLIAMGLGMILGCFMLMCKVFLNLLV